MALGKQGNARHKLWPISFHLHSFLFLCLFCSGHFFQKMSNCARGHQAWNVALRKLSLEYKTVRSIIDQKGKLKISCSRILSPSRASLEPPVRLYVMCDKFVNCRSFLHPPPTKQSAKICHTKTEKWKKEKKRNPDISKYTTSLLDLQVSFVLEMDVDKVGAIGLYLHRFYIYTKKKREPVSILTVPLGLLPCSFFSLSPPRVKDSKPSAVSFHCASAERWLK